MKKQRSFVLFSTTVFGLVLLLLFNFQTIQGQKLESDFAPAPVIVLKAGDYNANTLVEPMFKVDSRAPLAVQSATFDVTYNGFSPEAEAAFQYAVDLWSMQISSPQIIRIQANWTPLASGTLGSAGSNGIIGNFSGGVPNTWYSQALADKLCNCDLNGGDFDIIANFNSTYGNWYFGTNGLTPAGDYDLVTVVLHEIGHGLGFSGYMRFDDGIYVRNSNFNECSNPPVAGNGCWGFSSGNPNPDYNGFPMIYDRFTQDGSGDSLIDTGVYANPSLALGNALLSQDLYFNGTNAVAAAGGLPKLYAPPAWDQGSSYSHLDEATYPAGDPNSLMTPQLGSAEAIHDPGQIALCMFKDTGWDTPNCFEPAIAVTPDSLTSRQLPDTQSVQSLTIGNPGSATLNWIIDEDTDTVQLINSIEESHLNGDLSINQPMLAAAATPVNLILDDGTQNGSVGIASGVSFLWLNRFTPDPADFPFVLDEIQIYFSSSNASVNELIDIYVYEDFDSDITNGVTHVYTLKDVPIPSVDSWSTFSIDPLLQLSGPGDVLIAVLNRSPSEPGPAAFDNTTDQGRSWIGYDGSFADPPVIPHSPSWETWAGNFMIRGVGRRDGVCVSPQDISWLSLSAASGSVTAGNNDLVDVTFDATGLAAGEYLGTLCVDSNDMENPQVQVPLTMTVVLENTWIGTTSDWDTDTNWSQVVVPDSDHAVVIPTTPSGGNMPVLSSAAAVDRITLETGSSLDLTTFAFTAETSVTNSGLLSQTVTSMPAGAPVDFLHIQNMASDSDKYLGVVITPTAVMGQTSVGIRGNSDCTLEDPADTVNRCFEIAPANQVGSDIRFYYLDSEEDSLNPVNMRAWHWSGSLPWISAGTHGGVGTAPPNYNWVEVSGVSSYSPFALSDALAGPTAVTLNKIIPSSLSNWVLSLTLLISSLLFILSVVILRKREQRR